MCSQNMYNIMCSQFIGPKKQDEEKVKFYMLPSFNIFRLSKEYLFA